MARHLKDAERARYSALGYVAPLRVLGAEEAAGCLARVEQFIDQLPGGEQAVTAAIRTKAHLHCAALLELVHLPAIVDPISDLLGPDLLCRSTSVFLKEAGDPAYVAWHQDAAYWELDPPDVATAWVALTESTIENGSLHVIPSTHLAPLLPHKVIDDPANMLSRNQAITAPIDEGNAVALTLAPGEMSIHDVRLVHGSGPNRSSKRRLGFAIRYVATHVRKTGPRRDTAILVRGTDRWGNFDPEPV
jgi:ectoine hydroxylase-related dioxygenase (phytanoyl-CoA dioxygenase family)